MALYATLTSGCYTNRIITNSELPYKNYYYLVHAGELKFMVYRIDVNNQVLTGKISDDKRPAGPVVHLYLADPKNYVISADRVINVPVDNISKAKASKFSWLLTAGTVAAVFILAPFVAVMIGGGYDM